VAAGHEVAGGDGQLEGEGQLVGRLDDDVELVLVGREDGDVELLLAVDHDLALPDEGAVVGLGEHEVIPRRVAGQRRQFGLRDGVLSELRGRTLQLLPELIGRRLDGDGDRHEEGHKEK
jgi:hypothetical protein